MAKTGPDGDWFSGSQEPTFQWQQQLQTGGPTCARLGRSWNSHGSRATHGSFLSATMHWVIILTASIACSLICLPMGRIGRGPGRFRAWVRPDYRLVLRSSVVGPFCWPWVLTRRHISALGRTDRFERCRASYYDTPDPVQSASASGQIQTDGTHRS
jgi:hypothetical protein